MLYNQDIDGLYLKNSDKIGRTSLLLPPKQFEFKSSFQIYGNKIAFLSRSYEDMTGVLIENENLQHDQLTLFRLAWAYAQSLPDNKKYSKIVLPF